MSEYPFFFKSNNQQLFGVVHRPVGADKVRNRMGVIFCEPFAEEKLWSHRAMVSFARILAKNSYWAMRFDCMGHGDSEGNFEDSNVETRIQDILNAMSILRNDYHVEKISLLGLRLGGTLAGVTASRTDKVDHLILWNPIIKVENYLYDVFRSNLTTQMATYKKIIYTRDQIVNDLKSGKVINVDGYLISPQFYAQGIKIDLMAEDFTFKQTAHVVNICSPPNEKKDPEILKYFEKLRQINNVSEFSVVAEDPFWKEIRTYYQSADSLFNVTLENLRSVTEAMD